MAQWHFSQAPIGMDQGPNNSTAEHFKTQDVFSALVRESIQNSLDVVLNEGEPVLVRYGFGEFDEELSASLNGIEDHVRACHQAYPDSQTYEKMVNYLNGQSGKCISYLKVSDYNTRGMAYIPGDKKCGFYSFVQSVGNSSKNAVGSGGSFGFGKAAYFEVSNSRSILVSSKSQNDKIAFQGSSVLCSHEIGNVAYNSSGFFNDGGRDPIQDIASIPQKLQRHEIGSDIYLLHVDYVSLSKDQYEECIVKSVLRNFWMAIYKERLVVEIDWNDDGDIEVTINKETLNKHMEKYYNNLDNEVDYSNPRPYYEIVKKAELFDENKDQSCVYFDEPDLRYVGHIRFYLEKNDGIRDRYLRMRKPLMIIDDVRMRGRNGLSGVLVCDGYANDFLSKAEPPPHDRWDPKLVSSHKNEKNSLEYKAWKALPAIKRFADDCIKQFLFNGELEETDIAGLDSLLYSTEDTKALKGNAIAQVGEILPESSDSETGAHTTSAGEGQIAARSFNGASTGKITVVIDAPKGVNKGGDVGESRTNTSKGNGKSGSTHTKGDSVMPKQNDDSNESMIPQNKIKKVSFRCFAKQRPEGLVYTLSIRTFENESLQKANIHISTMGADYDEDIPLAWSDCGSIENNAINGVDLNANEANQIQFRFIDNIKHMISLRVYVTE